MTTTVVLIVVCTYRRPQALSTTLLSLDAQVVPSGVRVDVLVVDNSPDFEAEKAVEQFARSTTLAVRYVRHGATNIASARNEAMDRAEANVDFMALIDDDEVADPSWLSGLLTAQRDTDADVVTGPVLATYPVNSPAWLHRDDFYSVLGPASGGHVTEAVTGNALLRWSTVRDIGARFDTDLGTSGGEDQLFFRALHVRGAHLWFEPSAIVREQVPAERMSLRYLLRREYRKGNTLGLLDRSRPGWPSGHPLRRLASSGYWAATGAGQIITGVARGRRPATAAGLLRVARASGMLVGLSGRTFHHYGRPASSTPVTVALVLAEDPAYQQAGHSRFLSGFVDHYLRLGVRVVLVVTEGRLAFVVRRRRPDAPVYRAPGVVDAGPFQVVVRPRLVLRWLAWTAFRSAPPKLQASVDFARTRMRSRQAVDHRLGQFLTTKAAEQVSSALHEERADVVLFSSLFTVPAPLDLPATTKATVLISHDVVSQRADSLRDRGYRVAPADLTAQSEIAAMTPMSAVLAIQWDDADAFRRLSPATDVLVSPVAMEQHQRNEQVSADRLLFVGSGSLPNVDGLRWFLDRAWPTVRHLRPSAELHVAGTVCSRMGRVPDGVVLRGEVPDLGPEYGRAAVVIVPLKTGSGLKVKLVEAVCHGAAVVTTSVGAQGLSRLTPRAYLLADEPEDFSAAVIQVLSDSNVRVNLERAAEEIARAFSPDVVYTELDDHLRERGVVLPDERGPLPV